jgi:hypothetical protein
VSERVIVCGGRDFEDRAYVFTVLSALHETRGIECVIEGGCRARRVDGTLLSADRYAAWWARDYGVELATIPADWKKHGKPAGPIRNAEMMRYNPSLVIAFPGGKGTADMVTKAKRAGTEVWEVNPPKAVSPNPAVLG